MSLGRQYEGDLRNYENYYNLGLIAKDNASIEQSHTGLNSSAIASKVSSHDYYALKNLPVSL